MAFAVVATTVLAGSRASANPPLQEWRHFDITTRAAAASALCGFEIWRHNEGDAHFTVFYDSAGAIVSEVDTFPSFKNTIWSPVTGKSYTSAGPAVLRTQYTDGAAVGSSATAELTGLVEKFGDFAIDTGRLVYASTVVGFDAAGVPLIRGFSEISSVGPDTGVSVAQARCDAMR